MINNLTQEQSGEFALFLIQGEAGLLLDGGRAPVLGSAIHKCPNP